MLNTLIMVGLMLVIEQPRVPPIDYAVCPVVIQRNAVDPDSGGWRVKRDCEAT